MVLRWTSMCLPVCLSIIGPSVIHLSVRPSVSPFFCSRMITWVNNNGFSPNLVCALILWRSGLGLLMGKFRQIFTELSARDMPKFLFPDDNLSKHKWIFTKLSMCIDFVEIWFRIANGQISSNFEWSYLPETHQYFRFPDENLSKCQGILTKLGTCIDMKEIWFGIAYGQILSMFDRAICLWHDNGRVL